MNVFDKEDSRALKGIAILLLIFHHCFRSHELYEKYTISFFPFPEGLVIHLALMGKICVALFAFISGYGLFLSYEKKRTTPTRWVISRYIKTFSGFWFVYVLLALTSCVIGRRFIKVYFADGLWMGIVSVFLDFLGLAKMFGTGTLIGTWWYMSAAIVFIILMPLLYKSIKEKSWVILIACMFFLRVILVRVEAGTFTGNNSIYAFIPSFLAGAIFAKDDLFNRWINIDCNKRAKKKMKCVLELFILCVLAVFYAKLPLKTFWEFKFCVVPIAFIIFCVEYI